MAVDDQASVTLAKRILRQLFRRSLWIITIAIVLVVVLVLKGSQLRDWLTAQEQLLRHWQQVFPIRTYAAACGLYFLATFVPGTNGKALVCGWLFGVLPGTLLVNGASTLAALVMFALGRRTLREHIQSRYAGYLATMAKRLETDGGAYLFAIRLVPVLPYSVVNVLMGVTEMKTRTFWWATQFGMLPGNVAIVFAGASLPNLQELQAKGWSELVSPQLIVACVVLLLMPLAMPAVGRLISSRGAGKRER